MNDEKQLDTKVNNELINQDAINEAKMLSGEMGGNRMPYIPVIKVSNTWEKMEDNSKKPPKKGFLMTNKEGNDYKTDFWKENLNAVILKVRYSIASKYKLDATDIDRFYSREFDRFDEIIEIKNGNGDEIAKGNYKHLCHEFATGQMNSMGKPQKNFDLMLIIYVNVDGTVYRLKLKGNSRNNFFEYKNSFGDSETFVGIKTNFNLEWAENGDTAYWFINYERGEVVNLTEQLEALKELSKYFKVIEKIDDNRNGMPLEKIATYVQDAPPDDGSQPEEKVEEEGAIDVEDIPF